MKNKGFYGWKVVFACFILMATMIPPVVTMASKFLIPVTTEFGISKSQFTLSNTILQMMGIFLSPVVSKHISNGKLKRTLIFSIIGYSLSFAAYGVATNIYTHYFISFVLGIFYLNVGTIPVSILINNWFVYKKGLAMSMAMAGTGVGGFIFSPLSTSLLGQFGWRKTYFIIACIVLIVSLIVTILFIKETPQEVGLEKLTHVQQNETSSKESKGIRDSFNNYKTKHFVILILIGMGLGAVAPPLLIGSIFKGENYSVAYGYVNSFMQAGMSIGALFVSVLADIFHTYTIAWIILFIFTILTGILWIAGYKQSKKFWV